jgi:MarR family transcriptional regulator, organic hydroperoxide resistance regulator
MNTDMVIDRIARIREKSNAFILAELSRRGVTGLAPSHGSLLAHLYQGGPLPMGRLADLIRRKKNTVTTLVRKLEAAGYVGCRKDEGDNRVTLVALTAKAEAFRGDFETISRDLLRRVWGDMPPAEREVLMAGLERLEANLG